MPRGQAASAEGTNYHTHALTRGLVVLEILADGPQPMTFATIHERSSLPKSTLVRLLAALCEGEFLVRTDDRPSYRLGHKVLHVARAYLDQLDVTQAAAAHLEALASASRQTANLGVRDRHQVVHVAVGVPRRTLRFDAAVGDRADLHATSLGKVLLSVLEDAQLDAVLGPEPYRALSPRTLTRRSELLRDLNEIRDRGWALDDNEHAEGLTCLAVPLLHEGAVIASLSVSGPSGELRPERHEELLGLLRTAAQDMAADHELIDALTHLGLDAAPEAASLQP